MGMRDISKTYFWTSSHRFTYILIRLVVPQLCRAKTEPTSGLIHNNGNLRPKKNKPLTIDLEDTIHPKRKLVLVSGESPIVQRSAKKYANLAKQDPGRAGQNS